MPQCHIIRPVEDIRGHSFDPADPCQGALGFTDRAACNEGMSHYDPTRSFRHLSPRCGDLGCDDICWRADTLIPEHFPRGMFIGKGQRGKGDLAMLVTQHKRSLHRVGDSAHQHSRRGGEDRHCLDPVTGIVVSRNHHYGGFGLVCHALEEVVELPDG